MVSRISAERHRAHDRLGAEKTHLDVHLNVNLTVAAEFNMDISKPSQAKRIRQRYLKLLCPWHPCELRLEQNWECMKVFTLDI